MQFLYTIFTIIVASSPAFGGVIGITDRLEGMSEAAVAADTISSLPTKSIRCAGMYFPVIGQNHRH
jgi:hypothetical protein